MHNRQVMVMHNEKIVADMARVSLEQEGYRVVAFLNAEHALQRLRAERFDVLITDHAEGMELLRTVKDSCPATKIITLSSSASSDAGLDAVLLDIHDSFRMPVRLRDLKASIRRAFQRPLEVTERQLAPELEAVAAS
ncbi:MAG: response regulator [Nitrospiraceae bacterium]|nr:response regulator [Nitrospiraceae bacterium]